MSAQDFCRLYPNRVVDITSSGSWMRDYRSTRRWFKTRVYWHGIRVPAFTWTVRWPRDRHVIPWRD